jgi:DNA-binding transcriptional ArsR family regulator
VPATTTPWDALGDATRRAVFESVLVQAQSVTDIAARLPVSRPAVSQHLAVLKSAGLVMDRAEGTRRVYSVDPAGLQRLRAELERFWDLALAAYVRAVEAPDAPVAPSLPRSSRAARPRRRTTVKERKPRS